MKSRFEKPERKIKAPVVREKKVFNTRTIIEDYLEEDYLEEEDNQEDKEDTISELNTQAT